MPRPAITRDTVNRLNNGDRIYGVEYEFGRQGDTDYFHDTLWEDWANRPTAEQTAEMNRRFDAFLAARNAPVAEPTPEEYQQQLAAIDQQIRDLQRQRLDIEDLTAGT